MAKELLIGPTRAPVKVRSPWAAALLPFITLGIYHLIWWYRINRELRDVGHGRGVDLGQNPTNSLLALFPGALIIIPPFVSYWRGTKRVMRAAELASTEPVIGWIALVLFVFIQPAYWAYLQSSLNHAWRAAAEKPADSARLAAMPPPAAIAPTADRDGATPAGAASAAPAASATSAAAPDGPADPAEPAAPGRDAAEPAAPDVRDPLIHGPPPADAPTDERGGEPGAPASADEPTARPD
jgi:hypothetical protein